MNPHTHRVALACLRSSDPAADLPPLPAERATERLETQSSTPRHPTRHRAPYRPVDRDACRSRRGRGGLYRGRGHTPTAALDARPDRTGGLRCHAQPGWLGARAGHVGPDTQPSHPAGRVARRGRAGRGHQGLASRHLPVHHRWRSWFHRGGGWRPGDPPAREGFVLRPGLSRRGAVIVIELPACGLPERVSVKTWVDLQQPPPCLDSDPPLPPIPGPPRPTS